MLKVIRYPDPFLRKKSIEVNQFNKDTHDFLDAMQQTMFAHNGVGLAAIQVGKALRILIINIPDENGEQHRENMLEIINPNITEQSGEILFNEGCLSVPDFYAEVLRYENITLEYQDRFGANKKLQAQNYLAVALQHEIDHLNGILFVDRLPLLKRKKFEKLLKKQQR